MDECLNSHYELEYIILRSDIDLANHPQIVSKLASNKTIVEPLPERTFKKLTATESSQGIVGVVKKPLLQESNIQGELAIALDRVSDPGNLGTIIRSAYWFSVKTILLSKDSADPFNQKVLRSSQGGLFHTNIIEDSDLQSKLTEASSSGYGVYLFDVNADAKLQEIVLPATSDKPRKAVIVFGNESSGISEELLSSGYQRIKIDGYSRSESLNVAISCAIALYEFRKFLGR